MIKKGRQQKGKTWDNAIQNNKNIKEGSKTYTRGTRTMRKATQEKKKGGQGQRQKGRRQKGQSIGIKKERKFTVRTCSERHYHKNSTKQLLVIPGYLRHFSPLIKIIKCNHQFQNKTLVRAIPSKYIQNFSNNCKTHRYVRVCVRKVLNYTLKLFCVVVCTEFKQFSIVPNCAIMTNTQILLLQCYI